jgi:3-hydroxyacyl-CoA dehydrogenase / enoyl-CoA hydratase / 3-hydroxybutyryl-CoA epimerase
MALFQTNCLWVQQLADNVAAIVLDPPGKSNLLTPALLADLEQALNAVEKEPRFEVTVLRSNKAASFCHGTDPSLWASLATPEAFRDYAELGQRLSARLANLRTPTVALVGGACLGGGLELALACDWRVAVQRPGTTLGFNEIEIGLIPSFGGIGRLLGLAGIERTLQMTLGGRKLGPRDARAWGLVDEIVADAADEPPAFLLQAQKREAATSRRRTWRQWFAESTAWGRNLVLRGAQRVLKQRLPDDMPAPWEALGVVRTHVQSGFDAGLAEARDAQARLAESSAFGNLAWLHQERERRRTQSGEAAGPRQLGVIGSTPLGLQLVLQTVARGRTVALRERDEMALGVTVLHLVRVLQEDVRRGQLSASDYTKHVNSVRPTVTWKNFAELDIVIDATPGDLEAKAALFRELEQHVPQSALLIVAGADVPIGALGQRLENPGRIAGLCFPPPVGRAAVVEISAGAETSSATTEALGAWATAYGKTPVVVSDSPGGVIRRVWAPGLYEALALLHEGMPTERIEQALQRFGMAHGALEYLDLLGIDEYVRLAGRLQPVWPNDVAGSEFLERMIAKGWLGAKTHIGFYRHQGGKKTLNRGVRSLLHQVGIRPAPPASVQEQLDEVRRRVVGAMIEQAKRCIAERAVSSADDLNLALALTGWAPHRGGPLRWRAS